MAAIIEIICVFLLILLNGFLSMTEFALVSARKARLQHMAERGSTGASIALELTEDPNTFLSTIQIGITLVGILAGAFGGAAIAVQLTPVLFGIPYISEYSAVISLGIVVIIITFLTIVFGELIPKRIGMAYPEQISTLISGPIRRFSWFLGPINQLCSLSTDAVLWIFGHKGSSESVVTEEDITSLLEEGTQAGVFNPAEQELVQSAFRFGDREVHSLMIPRPDVVYLDCDDPFEVNNEKILISGHTRYPICRGDLDQIIGVVSVRDLWTESTQGKKIDLEGLATDPLVIPEHITALKLLELFRTAATPLAIIMDEYGSLSGIITLHDLLEAIVGDLSTVDATESEPAIIQRDDGSWFVDGMTPVEDLRDLLEIESLPGEREGFFRTAAGFVISELGKIPISGDHFYRNGFRFEVADMDNRRVDKILISRVEKQETESK